ncbi:hypothetical protein [Flavobacterium sp.]|uniref:hypothetical protein n=1 Tax=Flavobacterium sp. TaxID=239 RepID=UPI003753954A
MKNLHIKTVLRNYNQSLIWLVMFIFIMPSISYSQEYRNIEAYVRDFSKNELFLKKSLLDYSSSIVEDYEESRAKTTSTRITEKLKKINSVLLQFDKGFDNNTMLRDSFIKMNQKTIECLTNGTLILSDYEAQSLKSIAEIGQNVKEREKNLISYFDELRRYEKSKKEFGLKYKLNINSFNGNNLFEYNAYQNILFYKINIYDQKLITSINNVNINDFYQSIIALEDINQEIILKTSIYKNNYTDNSLNNANIEYARFILVQKSKLTPYFYDFANEYVELQHLKNSAKKGTQEEITNYNNVVKAYNIKKKLLFDTIDNIQNSKKMMYNNWFITNTKFLKNNIKFDDLYESYTYNN